MLLLLLVVKSSYLYYQNGHQRAGSTWNTPKNNVYRKSLFTHLEKYQFLSFDVLLTYARHLLWIRTFVLSIFRRLAHFNRMSDAVHVVRPCSCIQQWSCRWQLRLWPVRELFVNYIRTRIVGSSILRVCEYFRRQTLDTGSCFQLYLPATAWLLYMWTHPKSPCYART